MYVYALVFCMFQEIFTPAFMELSSTLYIFRPLTIEKNVCTGWYCMKTIVVLWYFCMEETWKHVSVHWHQGNYQLWAYCLKCNPVAIAGLRVSRQLPHPLLSTPVDYCSNIYPASSPAESVKKKGLSWCISFTRVSTHIVCDTKVSLPKPRVHSLSSFQDTGHWTFPMMKNTGKPSPGCWRLLDQWRRLLRMMGTIWFVVEDTLLLRIISFIRALKKESTYEDTCLHIHYILYVSLICYEKQSYMIACFPYLQCIRRQNRKLLMIW